MSEDEIHEPKVKKPPISEDDEDLSPSLKKRRTAEDFFTFCNFILEYENYEGQKQEELRTKNNSPMGSTDSMVESVKSECTTTSSTSSQDRKVLDLEPVSPPKRRIPSCLSIHENGSSNFEDDSWDLVTCYCMKPFAGRPMIECSECLTWIHLSCAKIRKTNIPEEFICQRCKDAKLITRRSQRNRSEKRRLSLGDSSLNLDQLEDEPWD